MKSNHFETVESNDDLNGFGCRQWQIICHYIWLVQRCPFQRFHTHSHHSRAKQSNGHSRNQFQKGITRSSANSHHCRCKFTYHSFAWSRVASRKGLPVCKPLRHTNPLNDGKRVKNSSKSTHSYVFDSSILLKYFRTETINFLQRHSASLCERFELYEREQSTSLMINKLNKNDNFVDVDVHRRDWRELLKRE